MTQTLELPILETPARRRGLPAVPVLIRVPMIVGASRSPHRRPRRRRLRREVRVAALALLSAIPASLGFFVLGGDRPRTLAVAATGRAVDDDVPALSVSITLEPIVSLSAPGRDLDVPVILPGYLLPADATEEMNDGGR